MYGKTNKRRLYDPVAAQFLSVDPLAEEMLSSSPYSYCAHDPLNYTDPTGLIPKGGLSGSSYYDRIFGCMDLYTISTIVHIARYSPFDQGYSIFLSSRGLSMFSIFDLNVLLNFSNPSAFFGDIDPYAHRSGTTYIDKNNSTSGIDFNYGRNTYEDILLASNNNPPSNDSHADQSAGYYVSAGFVFFGGVGGAFDVGYAKDGAGNSSLFYTWGLGTGVEVGVGINRGDIQAGTSLEQFADPGGYGSINGSIFIFSGSFNGSSGTFSGGVSYGKLEAGASVRVNKTILIAPLPNRRKEKASYYSTFGHIKR